MRSHLTCRPCQTQHHHLQIPPAKMSDRGHCRYPSCVQERSRGRRAHDDLPHFQCINCEKCATRYGQAQHIRETHDSQFLSGHQFSSLHLRPPSPPPPPPIKYPKRCWCQRCPAQSGKHIHRHKSSEHYICTQCDDACQPGGSLKVWIGKQDRERHEKDNLGHACSLLEAAFGPAVPEPSVNPTPKPSAIPRLPEQLAPEQPASQVGGRSLHGPEQQSWQDFVLEVEQKWPESTLNELVQEVACAIEQRGGIWTSALEGVDNALWDDDPPFTVPSCECIDNQFEFNEDFWEQLMHNYRTNAIKKWRSPSAEIGGSIHQVLKSYQDPHPDETYYATNLGTKKPLLQMPGQKAALKLYATQIHPTTNITPKFSVVAPHIGQYLALALR